MKARLIKRFEDEISVLDRELTHDLPVNLLHVGFTDAEGRRLLRCGLSHGIVCSLRPPTERSVAASPVGTL